MTKAPTHHMVTMADGTVPPTSGSTGPYATVNLAELLGQVVDHPNPGKMCYCVSAFSYFRTYTQRGIGEVLERRGERRVEWPVRLWIVGPLGETGNWGGRHYPYWVLCHQLKVVEETEMKQRVKGARGVVSGVFGPEP